MWDVAARKQVAQFNSPEDYVFYLLWSPSGGFLVSGHHGGIVRFWDVRHLQADSLLEVQPAATTNEPVLPQWRRLATSQARLHAIELHQPISLIQDLLDATAGRETSGPVGQATAEPATGRRLREIAALRWPDEARLGIVALLVQPLGHSDDWKPPEDVPCNKVRDALLEALASPSITPEPPEVSTHALIKSIERVDDKLLSLLTMLGPEAVRADPALPLRLLHRVPELPALAAVQRQLLGLKVTCSGADGRSSGDSPDAERGTVSGIEMGRLGLRHHYGHLLPTQMALPDDLILIKQLRGELLFRSREVAEPPRLRPTVLVLDTSVASIPEIDALLRPAAHAVATTLRKHNLPVILITTGGGLGGKDRIVELRQPADLVELWTHHSNDIPDCARTLRLASSLRSTLRDGGSLEPIILLLTHPWFCADDDPLPRVEHLRGLFVQYPGYEVEPALSSTCERYQTLKSTDFSRLAGVLRELTG